VTGKSGKILIIGAGVIGLATAREIAKRKIAEVTVVERGQIGREASFAAAGMLTPNLECSAEDEFYLACRDSNRMFDSLSVELLDETGVDIDLARTGALAVATNTAEAEQAIKTVEGQIRIGVQVTFLSTKDARRFEPSLSDSIVGAAFYPEDGQVDNRRLIAALFKSAKKYGVKIREKTEIASLIVEKKKIRGARARSETIMADAVVVAAGAWTDRLLATINIAPLGLRPIRGQILAYLDCRVLPKHVVVGRRCYAVPRVDGRLLIGATSEDAGFCKQVLPESLNELRIAALEIFPWLERFNLCEAVAGLRPYCAGGNPVIGEIPSVKGLFVATGHYRNGILLSPLTAAILASEIADSSFESGRNPFRPSLTTLASAS